MQDVTHIAKPRTRDRSLLDDASVQPEPGSPAGDNRLGPSRGLLLGLVISAAIWVAIALAVWSLWL